MSRLDDLGEILAGYEGRKHKEEEVMLAVDEVEKALFDITRRMGMHHQITSLDYESKEAIAIAYYACLFYNVGNPKKQESSVNTFCQDLEVLLNNSPKDVSSRNVKQFAEDYAKNMEANA